MTTINDAVAVCFFGKATAAKRGRNPEWPYVPVIDRTPAFDASALAGEGRIARQHTEQLKGFAFKTRDEAVEFAQKTIDLRREHLRQQLGEPRMRALRRQHNVSEDEIIREANERVGHWPSDMFGATRKR